MERRKHPRVGVRFRVALAFAGGRTEGEGEMLNLSEGGCAVKGDKRVPEKAILNLSIYPPGREAPIVIENAAVRWVRGWDFGIEFVSLSPEERADVQMLLHELKGFMAAPTNNPIGKQGA